MAEERMPVLDALRKGEEAAGDPLREMIRWTIQELMEAEVAAQIGAGRYERSGERVTQRNGYRTRPWDTRVGTLELEIPKLRQGSYFPSWLEPRRRAEQALVAVVAEAYVQGVSTRKVEALVQALGIAGISKSEVSRLAATLDEQVEAFRTRRLDASYPYLWVDARYEHVRDGGRVGAKGPGRRFPAAGGNAWGRSGTSRAPLGGATGRSVANRRILPSRDSSP